jgi:penicillin-binding protein 2
MFILLFNRIFELQIVQGEMLENEFSLSILKERKLEGQRGNIYDRYGFPLAENIIAYNVLLDGSIRVDNMNQMIFELCQIIQHSGNEIVSELPITINEDGTFVYTQTESQILKFKKNIFVGNTSAALTSTEKNMMANDMFKYLRDELFEIPADIYTDEDVLSILNIRYPLWLNRYTQYQLETVAIDINDETLARIEENIWKFPGVSIVEDPLRVYNEAKYFAHIIGYTGTIDATTYEDLKSLGYSANDTVGKIGIEQEMEVYLKGKNGIQRVEVDNFGRTMNILETIEPAAGKNVYLTIDRDLQMECYNLLEQKLAYLLQSTLSMNGYSGKDKDDKVTLMRDVFSSLFSNNIYSIQKIEESTEGERQRRVYNTFLTAYNGLKNNITASLSDNLTYPTKEDMNYYTFILTKLKEEGYLLDGYKESPLYSKFMKSEVSFKQLLEEYVTNKLLTIESLGIKDEPPFEVIKGIILNEHVNYVTFKRAIYTGLAKKERFSYTDLCVALVEQGIVTTSEDQLRSLKNGSLGSMAFIKDMITKLELTPQQLALDPCSGSVVVTDVNTGEVLAMVSYPSYDNNRLVNNFDYEYYLSLLNDHSKPLFPMATQGKTAPGSTYKMVAAMAALEEGAIGVNEHFSCQGLYQKITPHAKCWIYDLGGTHGSLTVSGALEVSCNYFFYDMGYRLSKDSDNSYLDIRGVNALNEYATLLGLGTKTGIEIGDSDPTLPVQDAVRSSIGQTANTYTPVQLARYVSTLANGGTSYELNVIDKILENNGALFFDKTPAVTWKNDFEQTNIKTIQEGMYLVTSGSRGTARTIFSGFPIPVAGKTGTAQQSITRPDHGIFVGYAPYTKPEIGVSVVIPFGYGSTVPTIVGKDVIGAYYQIGEEKIDDEASFDHILD